MKIVLPGDREIQVTLDQYGNDQYHWADGRPMRLNEAYGGLRLDNLLEQVRQHDEKKDRSKALKDREADAAAAEELADDCWILLDRKTRALGRGPVEGKPVPVTLRRPKKGRSTDWLVTVEATGEKHTARVYRDRGEMNRYRKLTQRWEALDAETERLMDGRQYLKPKMTPVLVRDARSSQKYIVPLALTEDNDRTEGIIPLYPALAYNTYRTKDKRSLDSEAVGWVGFECYIAADGDKYTFLWRWWLATDDSGEDAGIAAGTFTEKRPQKAYEKMTVLAAYAVHPEADVEVWASRKDGNGSLFGADLGNTVSRKLSEAGTSESYCTVESFDLGAYVPLTDEKDEIGDKIQTLLSDSYYPSEEI